MYILDYRDMYDLKMGFLTSFIPNNNAGYFSETISPRYSLVGSAFLVIGGGNGIVMAMIIAILVHSTPQTQRFVQYGIEEDSAAYTYSGQEFCYTSTLPYFVLL